MPTVIEATYRVVTPMFCGGADPEGSIGPKRDAELRLASFKGVLRFWWRALAWSRFSGNLEAIREREDALFGSAGGGQSRASMRLVSICPVDGRSGAPSTRRQSVSAPPAVDKGKVLTVSPSGGSVVGEGARYLGYGVMKAFGQQKGQLTRTCLRSPFEFAVHFRVRDRGCSSNERQREWDDPESLADALTCLGTLGGMGAKSRKGYGSLVLRSLTVNGADRWRPPQTMDDLRDALARFRRNCDTGGLSGFPEYTAFSKQTRHLLVSMTPGGAREPLALLDLVGRELMRYRSWGRNGKVLGAESEKNFKDDHDLMKGPSRSRSSHPRRNPVTVAGALRAALARSRGWNGRGRWPQALRGILGDGPDHLGRLFLDGPFLLREGRPRFGPFGPPRSPNPRSSCPVTAPG